MSFGHEETLIVAATVGTTLAPWGLSFIQSYAVDKKLTMKDLGYERTDVLAGALLTGVIGFFVVVACAATLHESDVNIETAPRMRRRHLAPVAGDLAGLLFAVGLIGAAMLAAAILPLSTAYSDLRLHRVGGRPRLHLLRGPAVLPEQHRHHDGGRRHRAGPGHPTGRRSSSPPRCSTRSSCVPLLVLMARLSRDRSILGDHVVSRPWLVVQGVVVVAVLACVRAAADVTTVRTFDSPAPAA